MIRAAIPSSRLVVCVIRTKAIPGMGIVLEDYTLLGKLAHERCTTDVASGAISCGTAGA